MVEMPSYRDLCRELLGLSQIRLVGVIDSTGKILFSSNKPLISPDLSTSEAEDLLFRAAVRMGTRKEFLEKFGGIEYSFTEYGHVRQYSIPLDRDVKTILFIQVEKFDGSGDPLHSTIGKILDILKQY